MGSAKHIQKQLTGASGFSGSLGATRAMLRRQLWIWPVLAALLLGGVGWWVHGSVEEAMREELAGQLTTILNADVEALHTWTRDQEAIARSLAQLPALRSAARGLLAADRPDAKAGSLPAAREVADCRTLLGPHLEVFGYTHFYVVSPGMQIVASNEDELPKTFQVDYPRAFARKALDRGAGVSRPFRAVALLRDAKGEFKAGVPTMLAAAAIPDEKGRPIALLALRIRPEAQFTKILQTARFGESGETYAFSETGLLLSQSRFDNDLKRLGLLPDVPGSQSILTVEVRDP